jgi:hypothetical protein
MVFTLVNSLLKNIVSRYLFQKSTRLFVIKRPSYIFSIALVNKLTGTLIQDSKGAGVACIVMVLFI